MLFQEIAQLQVALLFTERDCCNRSGCSNPINHVSKPDIFFRKRPDFSLVNLMDGPNNFSFAVPDENGALILHGTNRPFHGNLFHVYGHVSENMRKDSATWMQKYI